MNQQISYSANKVFNYFACSDGVTSYLNTISSILDFIPLEILRTSQNEITFSLQVPTNETLWQIVPTLTINTSQDYSYYFSLECISNNENECAVLTNIGVDNSKDKNFTSQAVNSFNVKSDIDSFVLEKDFNKILIHLHVDETLLNANNWFVSITCKCKEKVNRNFSITNESIFQNVPEISQMTIPDIGPRICSPTCVTMLLQS